MVGCGCLGSRFGIALSLLVVATFCAVPARAEVDTGWTMLYVSHVYPAAGTHAYGPPSVHVLAEQLHLRAINGDGIAESVQSFRSTEMRDSYEARVDPHGRISVRIPASWEKVVFVYQLSQHAWEPFKTRAPLAGPGQRWGQAVIVLPLGSRSLFELQDGGYYLRHGLKAPGDPVAAMITMLLTESEEAMRAASAWLNAPAGSNEPTSQYNVIGYLMGMIDNLRLERDDARTRLAAYEGELAARTAVVQAIGGGGLGETATSASLSAELEGEVSRFREMVNRYRQSISQAEATLTNLEQKLAAVRARAQ